MFFELVKTTDAVFVDVEEVEDEESVELTDVGLTGNDPVTVIGWVVVGVGGVVFVNGGVVIGVVGDVFVNGGVVIGVIGVVGVVIGVVGVVVVCAVEFMRMLLAPIVTAPPSANAFPVRTTSAPVVIYAPAITMPLKLVEAPGAK